MSTLSQQLEPIVHVGTVAVTLAGVAALARAMSRATQGPAHNSIPRASLKRIAQRYGWWAARRAEAFCPENDVACVEREAQRLFEVTTYRRR